MKLRSVLMCLVFAVVGVACGKRVEYSAGQKGDTGEVGGDGAGCSDEAFGPSDEYPNGGITITCGDDDPIVLTNGADSPRYKKHKKPKKD